MQPRSCVILCYVASRSLMLLGVKCAKNNSSTFYNLIQYVIDFLAYYNIFSPYVRLQWWRSKDKSKTSSFGHIIKHEHLSINKSTIKFITLLNNVIVSSFQKAHILVTLLDIPYIYITSYIFTSHSFTSKGPSLFFHIVMPISHFLHKRNLRGWK